MPVPLGAIVISCLAGLPQAAEPPTVVLSRLLSTGEGDTGGTARLMVQPIEIPETVYVPPRVVDPSQGYNEGALSLEITGRYMTDYVYRGLEVVEPATGEDAANVQIDATLRLDLGRLPDPFVHLFTNTAEGDDISNFQVIRSSIGLHWETEPFSLTVGTQNYTYPDRSDLDTAEVFGELRINDGVVVAEEGAILGPFLLVAYDYDRFEGAYAEGGLRRSFDLPAPNLRLTLEGLVAYVNNYELYSSDPNRAGSGFSHYQVGAIAEYRLNSLLNISRRYGQWSLTGYLYYTDGLDNDLTASTQIWGGGGITFRY